MYSALKFSFRYREVDDDPLATPNPFSVFKQPARVAAGVAPQPAASAPTQQATGFNIQASGFGNVGQGAKAKSTLSTSLATQQSAQSGFSMPAGPIAQFQPPTTIAGQLLSHSEGYIHTYIEKHLHNFTYENEFQKVHTLEITIVDF